ncbi:OmpA family protein [Pseudomonas sp. GL-B-19]|uniref:OmpA family protein n=1 Tax=Pseudomonas sp. GL-B-19 TaxID=2832393 RepID=UPI001CBFEE2D|nr:OmpA family protein [Pseudomonas sp. GL-B-19]
MSSKPTLALALCFAITGCAQTPQSDSDGGSWWPFGSSDKVAAKEPTPAPVPLKPAATAPVAKTESTSPWYWPFGGSEKSAAKAVPMPDPKVTQAWLDEYEPRLREAIKDSNLKLERRENVLVVIAPVEGSFNPDRPAMLLPVTLGPFTRVAKILEVDPKTAVLVLGHSDTSGAAPANVKLSQERAQAVAAIFRLSGLQRDRLMLRGMGGDAPRAANDSVEGRALNRRVELLVTPQNTMVALLAKYNMPAPAPVSTVAAKDIKPVATPAKPVTPAPAAKKAAVPATKKAPASKATAKKAPAKTATPAKKTTPAKAAADTKKADVAADATKK